MTEADRTAQALRRKIGAARVPEAGPTVESAVRAFRVAIARAARDEAGLDLAVSRLTEQRLSLAELLEMPPERAFLAMLEGPEGGLGMIALSPEVLAALIEVQTVGRLTGTAAPPRRPTRTDAAMVVSTLDRCLRDLEIALAEAPDLSWAGGFHYASFLDDPRPLGLLLDDQPYRVLSAEVTLDDGAGRGSVLLALPAAGRGPKPAPRSAPPQDAAAAARAWSQAMAQAVNGAAVQLDAVMGRIRVPLEQVMALEPGALIPIGAASLDSVALEAAGGRRVADARLGQNRGMRALRLTRLEELGPPRPAPVPAVTQPAPDPARAAPALARSA